MRARLCRRIRKLSVNPLFFVVIGIFFAVEHSLFAAMLLCAAFLHETGHILMVIAAGGTISELRLLPFGVDIRLECGLPFSYRKDALIALSGPAANLAALVILVAASRLWPHSPQLISYGIISNLGLCLMNVLPALPLDGGRALEALCLARLSPPAARALMLSLTLVVTGLIFAAGLWLLIATGCNASLLFIAVYLMAFILTKYYSIGAPA